MKIDEVLKLNIDLQPDQLRQLSEDINKTLSQPMNINTIIEDTTQNLTLAKTLNEEAEKKQMAAKNILQVAERVEKALSETQDIQKTVNDGIFVTSQNIVDANNSLTKVKSETDLAKDSLQKVTELIDSIEAKLKTLQTGFLKNVRDADEVKSEAKTLVQEVDDTKNKALKLVDDYNNANTTLENRVKVLKTTRSNSQNLSEKASQLLANTTLKLKELEDAEIVFAEQEMLLSKLSKATDELNARMSDNLEKINSQSEHYRTCNN